MRTNFLRGAKGTHKPTVEVDTPEDAQALAEVYRAVRMARILDSQMMGDDGQRFMTSTIQAIANAERLTAMMVREEYGQDHRALAFK